MVDHGRRTRIFDASRPSQSRAGALDHSGFAEDPFGRVSRTIQGMGVLIFGTTHEANAMARHINRLFQEGICQVASTSTRS